MKIHINGGTFLAMKMSTLLLIIVLLMPGWAESAKNLPRALEFVIPILPEGERYLDLLAYPPYLAVALDNNGITPSHLSRAVIVDGHTSKLGNVFLRFSEKRGPLFIYQAKME
jgi:hypothetical protein